LSTLVPLWRGTQVYYHYHYQWARRNQNQSLHALKSNGMDIRLSDLAFLSPYATSKLKRFGGYPTDLKPDSMPLRKTLPT
jgi:hypothetical protein